MLRIKLSFPPQVFRFQDSVHATLVAGITAAGVPSSDVIGGFAKPWTFATKWQSNGRAASSLTEIILSTTDPGLASAFATLSPAALRWNSSNGDRIDLSKAKFEVLSDPVAPGQDCIRFGFASPFVLSNKDDEGKNAWLKSFPAEDMLSDAFSKGLSKRLGRNIELKVSIDRMCALLAVGPRVVPVRLHRDRTICIPAFDVDIDVQAKEADLRAAFYAGLGQKTRYGFGCLITS